MKYDAETKGLVPVFTAQPIPNGMTVIATPRADTPSSSPPSAASNENAAVRTPLASSLGQQAQKPSNNGFNPDAAPFVPKSLSVQVDANGNDVTTVNTSISVEKEDEKREEEEEGTAVSRFAPTQSDSGQKRVPWVMYWSTNCPEGTLMPLRQPQPPVYFENDVK